MGVGGSCSVAGWNAALQQGDIISGRFNKFSSESKSDKSNIIVCGVIVCVFVIVWCVK